MSENWTSRAKKLLEERHEDIAAEIRHAWDERKNESFGRVTPEAAMKNLELSLEDRKRDEEMRLQAEAWRAERMKIPVPIDLAEIGTLEISRLIFEEIEARMACHISYDDECENMTADVLIVLLRHGVIKLRETATSVAEKGRER